MPERKPILCVDFDGVIHSYKSGWSGPTIIRDGPVPGAMDFLRDALTSFRVTIFSSRSGEPGGIEAMQDWLKDWAAREHPYFAWVHDIEWPTKKPSAFVTLDDRAITFTGHFPSLTFLLTFKPWNKK
jgi:hypothetical protein